MGFTTCLCCDPNHCNLTDRWEDAPMEANTMDPREHVNEEPRNDFSDVLFGFNAMFGFMFVVFFGMVIVKFIMS